MTITSYSRGHKLIWVKNAWYYHDTLEPFDNSRSCIRCGLSPTDNGHDPCLGIIPDVKAACCGHGIGPGYRMKR